MINKIMQNSSQKQSLDQMLVFRFCLSATVKVLFKKYPEPIEQKGGGEREILQRFLTQTL